MAKRQRRLRGEGSIRFRQSSGKWEARFPQAEGPDGKRRRLYGYADTKDGAIKKLAELRARAAQPDAKTPDAMTVERFLLGRWLPSLDGRPGTKANYADTVRLHVIPVIGSVRLADLQADHLTQVMTAAKQKALMPRTVVHIRTVLLSALYWGEDGGLLTGVRAIGRNRTTRAPKPSKRNYSWLTPEVERKFLAAAENSPHRLLYRVMLALALRIGEVLALRWADVDFDNRAVTIVHQLQVVDGAIALVAPKTESSAATLPLDDDRLIADLRDWQARQILAKIAAPIWASRSPDGLIFTDEFGDYLPRTRLFWDFRAVVKAAGLPPMRIHDLRHLALTALIRSGVSPKIVQVYARHAKIGVTMDVYSHVLPSDLRVASRARASAVR